MKLGFLYAGQGSQHAGMGKDLYESSECFRKSIDAAAAVTGFDLKQVMFEDRDGIIGRTRYTQPVMTAFAVAMTELLKERGIVPSMTAGLSLGEYSALYSAGVLDAVEAVRTVEFRGKVMEEAAACIKSAMYAVMGSDRETVDRACAEASAFTGGLAVSCNFNCPGQIVIGGDKASAEKAAELLKKKGAGRCVPLKVSGPFHTPYMAPAGERLKEYFGTVEFGAESIPVIYNCLGDIRREGDGSIQELLVRQVQSAVYMEDSIRRMAEMKPDAVIEIGPGRVLSGFVKKTAAGLPVYAVETAAELEALEEALRAQGRK